MFTDLIEDAKIIVTTPSVTGDNRLQGIECPICIIDDASGISEAMSLIPLSHGVERLYMGSNFK